MSKAFVPNDGDNTPEEELEKGDDDSLPKGTKNYITPAGFERLRTELRSLLHGERPKLLEVIQWAASNGDRSENGDYLYGKRRLREIDRRIRFLNRRLDQAEVIDPAQQKGDRVLFGATVTVETGEGVVKVFSIVGIDEIDAGNGRISWTSPIGKALLNNRVGDTLSLQLPKGEEELTLLKIQFQPIPSIAAKTIAKTAAQSPRGSDEKK